MPLTRIYHDDGSYVDVDSEYSHAAPTEPVFTRAYLVKTSSTAPLDPSLFPTGTVIEPVDLPKDAQGKVAPEDPRVEEQRERREDRRSRHRDETTER